MLGADVALKVFLDGWPWLADAPLPTSRPLCDDRLYCATVRRKGGGTSLDANEAIPIG